MKRSLIPVAILAALALPGVASAHTPHVEAACGGLIVDLTNYEGGDTNNSVTVNIDGQAAVVLFGSHYYHGYAWDMTVAHQWQVVIDANLHSGNASQYDRTFNGGWMPCAPPPTTTTTTVPPTTTTVPVTTTTGPVVTTDPTTTVAITEPPVPPTIPPTVPPAPPATLPTSLVLPVTGSSDSLLLGIGLGLFAGGVIVLLISRWRLKP